MGEYVDDLRCHWRGHAGLVPDGHPDMFLSRALQKILSEKETKRKEHAKLRAACEAALDRISKETGVKVGEGDGAGDIGPDTPMPPPKADDNVVNADKYFHPFRLACESKSPRIIITALDCLQKLMAHGILTGHVMAEVEQQTEAVRLIDLIIETICKCFVGDATDEGVQLQIIKALLTAVTSSKCEVHENTLLKAVRTCYNIYLASKNMVNQTVAKASLTQMLSAVFQRMESVADMPAASVTSVKDADDTPAVAFSPPQTKKKGASMKKGDAPAAAPTPAPAPAPAPVPAAVPAKAPAAPTAKPAEEVSAVAPPKTDSAASDEPRVEPKAAATEGNAEEVPEQPVGERSSGTPAPDVTEITADLNDGDALNGESSTDAVVVLQDPDASGTTTPAPEGAEPGKYGFCVSCGKAANLWCGTTRMPVCCVECKNKNLEAVAGEPPVPAATFVPANVPPHMRDPRFGHVYRKDAFLVFRAMCKLSMKDLPDKDLVDPKSHELRSKILSLELQLSILHNAGKVFLADPLFLDAIKQYLCAALAMNGVSHVHSVFELSLAIFLELLKNFKMHLKMQIEVFLREILLPLLEISTSSYQHKWIVMCCLCKFCSDPQIIVDLYLNYDCDEYRTNIFERMVNNISKVAQGRALSEIGGTGTVQQEINLRNKGLECLVSIMRCLVQWTRGTEEDESSHDVDPPSPTPLVRTPQGSVLELDKLDSKDVPAAVAAAVATAAPKGTEHEVRKQKKELLEAGIELFNEKPKKGVAFLQEQGFIGQDPRSVGEFFLREDRLDKTQIGEFLGDPAPFAIQVMHAYTDAIDFSRCKDYVAALRLFLMGFRLPGEAQKIDRLMEKFAQRFCEVNPDNGVFATADAAYVLAYSIIMLTTDLHSTKVKKKMTKEQFVRNNRGINDSKDLPREYLESIFDAIEREEIRMKGQPAAPAPTGKTDQQKPEVVAQQLKVIAGHVIEAMKEVEGVVAEFLIAQQKDVDLAKPMFKITWQPLLTALTRGFSDSVDLPTVSLSLDGLQGCVHVACVFNMDPERRTLISSLAKFTNLTTNINDLKPKQFEAIRTLLQIAVDEGNFLDDSWKDMLTCVSQLELVLGVGSATVDKRQRRSQVVELLSETAAQHLTVAVDKIFTRSKELNGEAIVEFVKALCQVSIEELQLHPPRTYSMSKLVDIAHYNMERIRLEWSHIWAVMGDHFNKVGCMADQDVANFAVDSLRQLSIKFLEKGELANYSFQKEFLRPFEYIMNHNKAVAIRDMVVRCVAQMVQSKAGNIRSGWKNIFFVFSLAASDNDQNIVDLAFTTTKLIFEEYFGKKNDQRAVLIAGSFMDAVNCLAEFASNVFFPEISMEAIRQLRNCAKNVAESPELFVGQNEEPSEEPKIWVRGWFPVLFGLSRIINRCKLDVRTRALTVMFEIMKYHGGHFLSQWWKDIFDVIFRIFDDKKLQDMHTEQEKADWMNTTCNHALRSLVDVISQFFDVLQDVLLEDMFRLLENCIHRDNEALARSGTECLHILVMNNGFKFTDRSWGLFCGLLKSLFEGTAPQELMRFEHSETVESAEAASKELEKAKDKISDKIESRIAQQDLFNSIIIKCVVQLELIQTVEWIVLSSTRPESGNTPSRPPAPAAASGAASEVPINQASQRRQQARQQALAKTIDRAGDMFGCLTDSRLIWLLDCLEGSHSFAKAFNANNPLRTALWKAGFMKNRSKPNLLKQETTSLNCALRIMFRIYESEDRKGIWDLIEGRIETFVTATLHHFLHTVTRETREIWSPLIILILREFLNLDDERFAKHSRIHFSAITNLVCLTFDQQLGELSFFLAEFFTKSKSFAL